MLLNTEKFRRLKRRDVAKISDILGRILQNWFCYFTNALKLIRFGPGLINGHGRIL